MKGEKILRFTTLLLLISLLAFAVGFLEKSRFDALRLLMLIGGAGLGVLSATSFFWTAGRSSDSRLDDAVRVVNEANEILRSSSARLTKYFGDTARDLIPANSAFTRETFAEFLRSPLALLATVVLAAMVYFHPRFMDNEPGGGFASGIGLAALGLFFSWSFFLGLFLNILLLLKREIK